MQEARRRIFEKQFGTRANPASQWSINCRAECLRAACEDNYSADNWLVDSDAPVKATAATKYTLVRFSADFNVQMCG